MIIHFKKDTPEETVSLIADELQGISFVQNGERIMVVSSQVQALPESYSRYINETFLMDTDIQLAHKSYMPSREVAFGDVLMGNGLNTHLIGGPCSVESPDQMEQVAIFLKKLGIKTLRAGCFKPRTSPYSFQGLGKQGLEILSEIRKKHGLKIITEVKDSTHVEVVLEHTDIIQIGTKAMYDTSILRRCGQSQKPVLLKRGFGSTLQEFVQAAEFILSQGNPNVVLCERGIRTFESKTRFTLDLTGVAFIKHHINLPIVADPSHAMGYRYGVADLARAATAMGIDGLLIETHPTPEKALSDASQQLNFNEFEQMYHSLKPIAQAVGRTLI